jgi:exopolysaccharide production protein ExoY
VNDSVLASPCQVVRQHPLHEVAGRIIDVSIALLTLLVTLPIVAVVAILIRLDTPGPAIFRQTRVGKGDRLFTFYKFGTMYVDARARFPNLYRYEYTPEECRAFRFKTAEAPRLTRVGGRLRKTTIDELPNLVNVVKGEMTLVGPRPEIPEMVRYYEPFQRRKFSVKPGVTGLAQVNGRGLLTVQETLRCDLEYVETRSLRTDFQILMRTIKVILLQIGAF